MVTTFRQFGGRVGADGAAGVRNDTAQLLQIPRDQPAHDGDALALERVATMAESTNQRASSAPICKRQVTISANAKGRPPGTSVAM